MINVIRKEAYHDEEGNPQVDRAARSEHRNSNSNGPRSNKLSGLLNKKEVVVSNWQPPYLLSPYRQETPTSS